jgi:hypothetical protein
MLAERIGHLGAVLSHLDPFVSTQDIEAGVLRHLTCGIKLLLKYIFIEGADTNV